MKIFAFIAGFFKNRTLLIEFVERDIKTRYRKSFLGLLWTLLNPLLTMIIMTIVFSNLFKSNIPNFPVYLLSGMTIINFFSESTSNAMGSIIGNGSLIKKVYVPKYLFPMSKIFSTLVNMIASIIALVFVMLFVGVKVTPFILLAILPMLYVFIFSLGFGLILSSVAVFFRDTLHFYSVLLTLWTYMTPLFYPIEILPSATRLFVELNPLTSIVEYMRIVTLYGGAPPFALNIICLIPSLTVLLVGLIIFYKTQDKFILHM